MLKRPIPYQPGTLTLWSDEYIADNVLRKHLNPDIDSGSRKESTIKETVSWITNKYSESSSVLDVGCGPGLYAPLFYNAGWKYTGFDVSPYQIRYALQHFSNCNARFEKKDFRNWSSNEKYDAVLLLYGIYSFYEKSERLGFLKKIKKNLNKRGIVLIEVFTRRHYDARQDSTDWEYVEHDGFWSDKPYLELNSFQKYDENLVLVRAAVINKKCEVWNSWITTFSLTELENELAEAGYKMREYYSSCYGTTYSEDSEVLFVVAEPQEVSCDR